MPAQETSLCSRARPLEPGLAHLKCPGHLPRTHAIRRGHRARAFHRGVMRRAVACPPTAHAKRLSIPRSTLTLGTHLWQRWRAWQRRPRPTRPAGRAACAAAQRSPAGVNGWACAFWGRVGAPLHPKVTAVASAQEARQPPCVTPGAAAAAVCGGGSARTGCDPMGAGPTCCSGQTTHSAKDAVPPRFALARTAAASTGVRLCSRPRGPVTLGEPITRAAGHGASAGPRLVLPMVCVRLHSHQLSATVACCAPRRLPRRPTPR